MLVAALLETRRPTLLSVVLAVPVQTFLGLLILVVSQIFLALSFLVLLVAVVKTLAVLNFPADPILFVLNQNQIAVVLVLNPVPAVRQIGHLTSDLNLIVAVVFAVFLFLV